MNRVYQEWEVSSWLGANDIFQIKKLFFNKILIFSIDPLDLNGAISLKGSWPSL